MLKRNWSGLLAVLIAAGLLTAGLMEGDGPLSTLERGDTPVMGVLTPKASTKTPAPTIPPTNTPRPTETQIVPPTPTQELCRRMQVSSASLNVRSSPEIADNIVDVVRGGTIITVTNDEFTDGKWYYRQIDGRQEFVAWFAVRGSTSFLRPYEGCR